jgi:hypothetical protein
MRKYDCWSPVWDNLRNLPEFEKRKKVYFRDLYHEVFMIGLILEGGGRRFDGVDG